MLLIGRIAGMLAGGVTAVLWLAVIWFPVGGMQLEGYAVGYALGLVVVALVSAISSFHGHAGIVFLCFVIQFFGVGTRAINAGTWFQLFGILNLLLLLASVMLWTANRRKEPQS
jgi:hypothetical protein